GLAAAASSHDISVGDLLSISVYRQEDMTLKVRVDNAGNIRFPLAGRIHAAGMSPSSIEGVIAGALRRNGFASPEVVVSVEQFAPRKVYVLGEINATGDLSINIPEGAEISAMQAVSAAGGLTQSADVNNIVVRRTEKGGAVKVLKVPAADVLAGRDARDVMLQPTDTVVVGKARPISVLGTAKKPGHFYTTPDSPLTVSRVVALAGGVERPNSLKKIRVMRGDQAYNVDIFGMLEDGEKGKDMALQPGDVVYVPETRW
ncbi:MAG: polysaccharide biosynthesis/export family protein, partial [Duodenibacillus sp.]|nr:polysaccharide biosynthesis/export family protein [Duodenibacillus sp.]